MYWSMLKNRTILLITLLSVPIFAALVILLAFLITYTIDDESFTRSLLFSATLPICGQGLIGVYPASHPASLYLSQQAEYFKKDSFHPQIRLIEEDDFQKHCVDKLYDVPKSHPYLVGCIDFSKISPTPSVLPTTAPTYTKLLQYDVFTMTHNPLMEPLNKGKFYELESNPSIEDIFCGYEYLSTANNIASTALLHHYGLYSNPWSESQIEPQSSADASSLFKNPTDFIRPHATTVISPESTLVLTNEDGNVNTNINTHTTTQFDPLQQTPPIHHGFGPISFNTRIMTNWNTFRDHGKVYNTFLAQEAITIVLFLPIFLLVIIPFTQLKQDGQIALLLINGINHVSILIAMMLFALSLGLGPMILYSYFIFVWWSSFPVGYMILYYIMYFIAAASFVLLIGSVCTRVRPAVQLLIGLFAIFAFLGFFVDDMPFIVNFFFAPFIFQFAYALTWKTFLVYITHTSSLHFSPTFTAYNGVSYLTGIILLFINIIITFVLSIYLQQIIPSQGVVAKPWDFIFDLSLWSLSSATAQDVSDYQEYGHRYITFSPPKYGNIHSNQSTSFNSSSTNGSYAQQTDEEEEGSEMIDDLGQRQQGDNSSTQHTMVNLDDIDIDPDHSLSSLDDAKLGYGYLPPLHPYQPLNEYEVDNIAISIRHLRKSFHTPTLRTTHVLKNVSLDIARQIVVIMGKNGSGKSLFLQLLTGLSLPTAGTIKVTLPQRSQRTTNTDTISTYTATHDTITTQSPADLDPFATDMTSNDPFADPNAVALSDNTNTTPQQQQQHQSPQQNDNGSGITGTMNSFFDALNNAATSNSTYASNPYSSSPRPLFGYCPQENSLFPWLTVHEQLYHMSVLIQQSYLGKNDHILDDENIERVIVDVTSRLGLNNKAILDSKIETLPPGIQRRICIAIATLHHPSIILLDDPLSSLDLHSQHLLLDYLQYLKTLGSTIVMTSNNIHQVDFADKIGILSNGNMLLYGSPQYLKSLYNAGYTLQIEKVVKEDEMGDLLQVGTNVIPAGYATDVNENTTTSDKAQQQSPSLHTTREGEILTTKSGTAIWNMIHSHHKFSQMCHLTYDSNIETTYIIEQGTALTSLIPSGSFSNSPSQNGSFSNSLSSSGQPLQSAIPQLVSYLESQKESLGISKVKLSMKTLEDVFLAANQGKTTLRLNKTSISDHIAEGTLPELAMAIEEREYLQQQDLDKRRKLAQKYSTNLDDNNSPHVQLMSNNVNNSKTVGPSDSSDDYKGGDLNDPIPDDINKINHDDLLNPTTIDSQQDTISTYHNLSPSVASNGFELWSQPFEEPPFESLLLTQVAGHLKKDYQILWNTPTKLYYLIFVPLFVCIAIFFVAPHDIILSTSSQPLALTLQTMPSQTPIEMGISTNPSPFSITTDDNEQSPQEQFQPTADIKASRLQINEYITAALNPHYVFDEYTRFVLKKLDLLDQFKENKKHQPPHLLKLNTPFTDDNIDNFGTFRSSSQFSYDNPRFLSILVSEKSTIDDQTDTFTNLKGTMYVNHTSIPLGLSLSTRMHETLYNYAAAQRYNSQQTAALVDEFMMLDEQQMESSLNKIEQEYQSMSTQQTTTIPSAIMLMPTVTQIHNQSNLTANAGHSIVLGILIAFGLSCYPIIQSYYYTRDKSNGWDDVQRIHGLYTSTKWFSRAVYDLSIYLIHVLVIAFSVSLSGFYSTAAASFEDYDYEWSVVGSYVTLCLVIGIQLLIFMHCFIYFFKNPIQAQTYLMMTLFFGPIFILLAVVITAIIPAIAIIVLIIGAMCPTCLLLVGVMATLESPDQLWVIMVISVLQSILLGILAVAFATKPLNCTAENILFGNRTPPEAITQNPNDHSPYRHVYVSELASHEMHSVVNDYTDKSHPILSYGMVKRFGAITAVNKAYLGVAQGQTMGIVAPNQAGKTTLLKLLLNLTSVSYNNRTTQYPSNRPYNTGRLGGNDSQSKIVERTFHRTGVGYCPQDLSFLTPHLSARQHLEWVGAIRGLSEQLTYEFTNHLLTATGLSKVADLRVQGYTIGMKQRLAVALALVGNPGIVILDEMTGMADPLSALQIRDLLERTKGGGHINSDGEPTSRTTLFTSHNIADVEALADRVCIMSHGVVTAVGTQDELVQSLGQYFSLIVKTRPQQEEQAISLLLRTFSDHPNVTEFDTQQAMLQATGPVASNLADFVGSAAGSNAEPQQVGAVVGHHHPIKLIESRHQHVTFHISTHYFSISSIFDILFALQTQYESIIEDYTVNHLGLEDCLRASVASTSLSEQRNNLPANIIPDSDDDDNHNGNNNNGLTSPSDVVLDTTLTTSAAAAIASSTSFYNQNPNQNLYDN